MPETQVKRFSLLASVFVLSACALSYEILLMRLFAIIQWHHFAYMVIGLALLGYGVSGTVISLFRDFFQRHFSSAYISSILLFAFTSSMVFMLAQHIPFNPEVILWDWHQIVYLMVIFILLSIPFFFAASAFCLAFMTYPSRLAPIYAADLTGAALGSLGIIVLLFWFFPNQALFFISLLGLVAALIALPLANSRTATILTSLMLIGTVFFNLFFNTDLKLSEYKSLSQMLQIQGSEVLHQKSSPLGLLTTVENKTIPLRHAPGLSLNANQLILPQIALFTDGDNLSAITRYPEKPDDLAYLGYMTSALAYKLAKPANTLIVGGSGGSDILQAIYHDAETIDVLEINPQTIQLVNKDLGGYSSKLYSHEKVNSYTSDVRDYLTKTNKSYALVQISLMDAFNASSSGLHALHENYLYTVEAIKLYLQSLKENGYLSMTRWINMPPRDTLKLLNTTIQSMQELGFDNPGESIIFIRGWQTATLLVKNGKFTSEELQLTRHFNKQRSFDPAWLPDIRREEVNQYNRLASPLFYHAASALLSDEREAFINSYKFNLSPATDDKPFFHHFFKWNTFTELLALREQGGMPLIEWGYLILLASLLIAIMSSILLIVIPSIFLRRNKSRQKSAVRYRQVIMYFTLIGLAFLMIEISFIQKFILFLHHPIYSVTLTLSTFLFFAGIGSYASGKLIQSRKKSHVLAFSCIGIFVIGIAYLVILPSLFNLFSDAGMTIKILLSAICIAPLAILMGMPFPLALDALSRHADHLIPWAWSINGCASVISASLSTILAINFGFNLVIITAGILYLMALLFFPVPKTSTSFKRL